MDFVEGNAEITATADFVTRHLLNLGADADHDVYQFAGAVGLGAPVHLGIGENPIIFVHWRTAQHYTGTRMLKDMHWRSVHVSTSFVYRMQTECVSSTVRARL